MYAKWSSLLRFGTLLFLPLASGVVVGMTAAVGVAEIGIVVGFAVDLET